MEDVLTEIPPPSRFFQEDLDNFAAAPPPLPPPLLLLSPNPNPNPLLILALSAPSLAAFHRIPHKTLAGTLILPELPLAGTSLLPSPRDPTCQIYTLHSRTPSPAPALLVALQFPVAPERARDVAKSLLGGLKAGKVLILDSIRSGNYRGRLAVDETLAFKLETLEERRCGGDRLVDGVDYLPSGSVMDGLGAAVLGECQMKGIRGTLVATWPGSGRASWGPITKIRSMMRELGIDVADSAVEDEFFGASSHYDSDLYT